MALDGLHAMAPRISPVAVHFEGDMLRHRALLQSPDKQLSKMVDGPFSGGGLEDELADDGHEIGHVGGPRRHGSAGMAGRGVSCDKQTGGGMAVDGRFLRVSG